jgi:hypothetical protein
MRFRSQIAVSLLHELAPAFDRDDRDRAKSTSVGVADDATLVERRGVFAVHDPAVSTLDENGCELSR